MSISLMPVVPVFPTYEHEPPVPKLARINDKLDCQTLAWAIKPVDWSNHKRGELWFASFTQRYGILRAVWAAIHDAKAKTHVMDFQKHSRYGYSDYYYAWRPSGKGIYHTVWNTEPLEKAGAYAHMVLTHNSWHDPKTGQPFMHLSMNNIGPDLGRFFAQLDNALTLAIAPEWVDDLWNMGKRKYLIKAMPSHNCLAWLVETDELKWASIITELHTGNPHAPVNIITFGLEKPKEEDDLVAEVEDEVIDDD